MSYIEKCAEKRDLLFNKLKPSRNLIVFIVSENVYVAYTLNEMKEIMTPVNNHYVEDTNKLERFFYLPNGIRIDSSLKTCFEQKTNTMKLVKSENKFYLGFEDNKQYHGYYSVEAVLRHTIDSNEESTFTTEYTDKTNSESDVEIDTALLLKQRNERKAKEKLQIERKLDEERNTGNYTETINYENGVECKIEYVNRNKRIEKWFTNNILNRDNDLPAWIEYYENGNKKYEEWLINDQLHRDNELPAQIEYYENGNKESEVWIINDEVHRDNGLPACINYYENGNKKYEEWWKNDQRHRDNDLPADIDYYENKNKRCESWWVNGQRHRTNDNPARIKYHENGNKRSEEWLIDDLLYRDNNLPTYIDYYEDGIKRSEDRSIGKELRDIGGFGELL